jgi:hypothetical protein
MTSEEITQYLHELNDELRFLNVKGEVSLFYRAVMCLAFKARPATKDVDAIFELVREIRNAANRIADRHDLNIGWLNMAVKMFVVEYERTVLFDLSHLKVFVPEGRYLFAMKVLAARADTSDLGDIEFLSEHLEIKTVEQAVEIVQNYYPNKEIKPETVFLLEEILAK